MVKKEASGVWVLGEVGGRNLGKTRTMQLLEKKFVSRLSLLEEYRLLLGAIGRAIRRPGCPLSWYMACRAEGPNGENWALYPVFGVLGRRNQGTRDFRSQLWASSVN